MFSDPSANLSKLGLTDGMKVVDLGAGSGYYTLEAARRVGASGRVYSVDIQKDLLERIRSLGVAQGLRNIEIVWGNVEQIGGTKLREALADRVIASNILFQIERPNDFALEIKRLLVPGGKLLVIDWSEASAIGPKTVVTARAAQTLFEAAGFALEQSFSAGDHHYGLVMVRR